MGSDGSRRPLTTIPEVPVSTGMFDGGADGSGLIAKPTDLTRVWIIFFERLRKMISDTVIKTSQPAGPYQRTLLIKDSTVGTDIADHVTAYAPGTIYRMVGVLRKPITAVLTVRVHVVKASNGQVIDLPDISIPITAAVNERTTVKCSQALEDGDIFTWDILASDGQADADGVASIDVDWQ